MNHNQFWTIIDSANQEVSHQDHNALFQKVKQALVRYSAEDIMDWERIRMEYHNEAYRFDLWAASAALGAHYTDDGFADFRCWLISCGREVYMAAMADPDSLANVDIEGEDLCFGDFGAVADCAYQEKVPFPAEIEEQEQDLWLLTNMHGHELSQNIRADLLAELPHRKDISSRWTENDLPELFPRIWGKHHFEASQTEPAETQEAAADNEAMAKLVDNLEVVYGYVYQGSEVEVYVFHRSPENMAYFIGCHPEADRMVLTDPLDRFIMNTMGNFIDQCPDKILLEQVKKVLIPIQLGAEEAGEFFCPTLDALETYAENRLEAEDDR